MATGTDQQTESLVVTDGRDYTPIDFFEEPDQKLIILYEGIK
jgi:hypothetical protein